MVKNYLIGIGGTGARVIESILHLCAAGYGPPSLSVFLVDPDQANANVSHTSSLLKSYQNAAKNWRGRPAVGHRQPFRTDVQFAEEPVWTIFKAKNETLLNFVNMTNLPTDDPACAQLISLLFSDVELKTSLDRGFRGHPSIGAVVMSNIEKASEGESEYILPAKGLEQFWSDIASCNVDEAHVFLVGSVFGGTGAAGVPTFGKPDMLTANPKALFKESGKSRILLGGALVLPYFTFSMDSQLLKSETETMFAKPADFRIATKSALEYYSEQKGNLDFNQLYLIGDSLDSDVGKFGTGGVEQYNRSHYVELVAGLAAIDFWQDDRATRAETPEYFLAAREDSDVTWAGLPVTRDTNLLDSLREKLTIQASAMTAFGYILNTYGKDFLDRGADDRGANKLQWYAQRFDWRNGPTNPRNVSSGEDRTRINAVSLYAREYVHWLAAMCQEKHVKLINPSMLLHERPAASTVSTESGPAGFYRSMLPPLDHRGNLGGFLTGLPRAAETLTFDDLIEVLNGEGEDNDPTKKGSDRFLNLVYEASYKFCERLLGLSSSQLS